MASRWTESERDAARDRLRELLPVGSTAFTILRSVSTSGMSRVISVVTVADGDPFDVTFLVARAAGGTLADGNGARGLRVRGAGMDMGFSVVYNLSRVIHGDGYAVSHRWL